MPVEVKICGLKDEANLRAALDAGADMVGFVFFPPSPRNIDIAPAVELLELAATKATRVALTVDADNDLLDAIVETGGIDLLQFHGQEPPERVAEVKTRYGLPVMKAIGIASSADVVEIDRYLNVADRILVDAKPPKDASRPGGHGRAFDWSILSALDPAIPFMLSGGLNPGNVIAAIETLQPAGIDVSSGVERASGIKDPDLIRAFIANARSVS